VGGRGAALVEVQGARGRSDRQDSGSRKCVKCGSIAPDRCRRLSIPLTHSCRGELGLTRSQMISLERELEHTHKQLRHSERRAEDAHVDYRTSRMAADGRGDDAFAMWD